MWFGYVPALLFYDTTTHDNKQRDDNVGGDNHTSSSIQQGGNTDDDDATLPDDEQGGDDDEDDDTGSSTKKDGDANDDGGDDTLTPKDEQGGDDDTGSSTKQDGNADEADDDDDDNNNNNNNNFVVDDDKVEDENEVDEEHIDANDGTGVETDGDDGDDDDIAGGNESDEIHIAHDDGVDEDKAKQDETVSPNEGQDIIESTNNGHEGNQDEEVMSLEERKKFLVDKHDDDLAGLRKPKPTPSGWWPDAKWIKACAKKDRDLVPFATKPEWVGYRLGDCVKICAGCPVDSKDLVPPNPKINAKHSQSLAPELSHNVSIGGMYWDLGCDPDGPRLHTKAGNETLLNQIIDSVGIREVFFRPDPDAIVIHLRLGNKIEVSILM